MSYTLVLQVKATKNFEAGLVPGEELQMATAACHAQARTADQTNWKRIVVLYDALVQTTQSPLVELNRAVAVSMAFGPAARREAPAVHQ